MGRALRVGVVVSLRWAGLRRRAGSGRTLLAALMVFGAGCVPSQLPSGTAAPPSHAGKILVTNLGTRTARIFALSNRGDELALGTVGPGETEEFAVDPSTLGSFRLIAGPLVPTPGVPRHASEGITVPWGWDVAWELRASPEFSSTRFSTIRTLNACARLRRC